jgi:hypothetical protein
MAEERLHRRLYGEATDKLKSLMAHMNADVRRECFNTWAAACEKKRRALRMWKNKTISWAFGNWYSELEEFFAIKDAVVQKCAGILHMIWGEAHHKALTAWKALCEKKRSAIMKWANAALISCLETWRTVTEDAVRVKKLLARVYRSWNQRSMRWGLVRWAQIADERLYNRDLVMDACSMWSNVRVIHAFRTLDEFAQEQIHYRRVVNNFRRRFELRPAQMAVSAWAELVAEAKWRQKQVRKFVFKFRNREVVNAFRRMQDAVQERKLEARQKLVNSSPVLMRLVMRPCFLTTGWWRAGIERRQHLRRAGSAVADKRNRIWMWDALDRWANVYVDLSFQDRIKELREAALTALETKDLSGMLDVLHSHAAWALPRSTSRCNLALDSFLSTEDSFDGAAAARRAASLRRVARVRQAHLRGAHAPDPDTRTIQLADILRIQKGLARETGGATALYWRAVEALSVILKGQVSHPRAPGAREAADTEGPEVELNNDVAADDEQMGATGLGLVQGEDLCYAPTPAATAREDHVTIQGLSWEALARVNVLHPKLKAQKQIVPTYLGGRYSYLGVEKLRAQVHVRYPLKFSEPWEMMRTELQDAELARRYFRARRKALAGIRPVLLAVKEAHDAASEAEREAIDAGETEALLRDEQNRMLEEAQRLEDENPFQNSSTIRKMRKQAEEIAVQAQAAGARGVAADQKAMEWRRRQEEEEHRLGTLVEEATPLLENRDEALGLLDWRAMSRMSFETLSSEFSAESDLGQTDTDAAVIHTCEEEAAESAQERLSLPQISGAYPVGEKVPRQPAEMLRSHAGDDAGDDAVIERTASLETTVSGGGWSDALSGPLSDHVSSLGSVAQRTPDGTNLRVLPQVDVCGVDVCGVDVCGTGITLL